MFHDLAGHEDLTETIIGCAIRVHETFGPGLLERVYKTCVGIELRDAGLKVDVSDVSPLVYHGRELEASSALTLSSTTS